MKRVSSFAPRQHAPVRAVSRWQQLLRQRAVAERKTTLGFTLIEVLCALALSGLLLSAVYGAVHMQWKFRTAGESHIEHAQVMQGFVEDFSSDVRGLKAIRPPVVVEKPKDVSRQFLALGFVPMTDIREQFLNLNTLTQRESVEFFGTSDFVLMKTSGSNSRFDFRSSSGPSESSLFGQPVFGAESSGRAARSTADQSSHVVWLNPSGRDLRVPFVRENRALRYRLVNLPQRADGVLRIVVRSEEVLHDATTAPLDLTIENSQVIAPEIRAIQFRFFDGQQWQAEWDSFVQQRLPSAIEVTLESTWETAVRTVIVRLPSS